MVAKIRGRKRCTNALCATVHCHLTSSTQLSCGSSWRRLRCTWRSAGTAPPPPADSEKTMKCNFCTLTKPAHLFSPARQRHRDAATWRCTENDFPPCLRCGAIPTQPKQKGYMCPRCLFPACACGAPRPPWTQNRVTVKPIWQCDACKK